MARLLEIMRRQWAGWKRFIRRLGHLYHPTTLRERGLLWSSGLLLVTLFIVLGLLGWYWSAEPEAFDVRQVAQQRAGLEKEQPVTGYTFTSTLMHVGEVLLDKRGGYLSKVNIPPNWIVVDSLRS